MNLNEETSEDVENKNIVDNTNNNFENKGNKNKTQKNMEIDKNKEININSEKINILNDNSIISKKITNENSLLNKKRNNDIDSTINDFNENKTTKIENNNKVKKEYDYGYTIILLEENEQGYMEDYLKEMPNESDISDYYNYNLDEEKFQEILKKSILIHYERHLKEEMEKRKKMQNMFMLNMNINMNNNIIQNNMIK